MCIRDRSYTGPRGPGWHLRAGLVAAYTQRIDQARVELAASRYDELDPADRGWHLFLQGMLADAANEPVRAGGFFQQAAAAAVSDLQRARFILAEEQVRLRAGGVNEVQLEADRKNAETYQNPVSYTHLFLGKLDAITDPDGKSVLHNSMIVYGCGNSDGNKHTHANLPVVLAGAGGGTLATGRSVRCGSTPMTNLYLSLIHI